MITITINDEKLKLTKDKFLNVDELLNYLLSFWKSNIEFENFNIDEEKYLENRSSKIKNLESKINLMLLKN
jgi:hypothetical protein